MQEAKETRVPSLGREDPLEEGVAAHSSVLAWRVPWTEEPGGLQSVGLHRVGHNCVRSTHMHNEVGSGTVADNKLKSFCCSSRIKQLPPD